METDIHRDKKTAKEFLEKLAGIQSDRQTDRQTYTKEEGRYT